MAAPKGTRSVISATSPILNIECKSAFDNLTAQEKLYAYYFARASWEGAKICYFQRSYESPGLFYLITKIFNAESIEALKKKSLAAGVTEEEWLQFTVYIAAFYQNCGNYKSFGDTKFVPEVSEFKFWHIITLSEFYKSNQELATKIWDLISFELYAWESPYYEIAINDEGGASSYYSTNISRKEVETLTKFLESIALSPLNTRVIKSAPNTFVIRVASTALAGVPADSVHSYKVDEENVYQIKITYKDFAPYLQKLVENLEQALKHVANDTQRKMLEAYVEHFKFGDMEKHKDSQRFWIKDINPVVETNIGFIETYLDPLKVRAEYEGFVAIVDKIQSKKLADLVGKAEQLIPLLPWEKAFEKPVFQKPDFTSLNVIAFASSGTPLGINIPNYDDVRQHDGFKNVDLGNVYGAPKKENVLYSTEENKELFVKWFKPSLFVKVALHELLGHGSGKLLARDKDGVFNWDKNALLNPFTGKPIETFYDVNETWSSKFGSISNAYEECRADSVALYLSCFDESLKILLPEIDPANYEEIRYMVWYGLVYNAIIGMETYNVESKRWGQAHRNGNFVMLRVLEEAGNNFVKIERITDEKGKPNLKIHLDGKQILTTGKKALGDFLAKLHTYKSMGDSVEGTKMFQYYSQVDDEKVEVRKIVFDTKLPRRLELQHDLELIDDGKNVQYVSFPETFEGVIKSQLFHYRGQVDDVLQPWLDDVVCMRIPRA